MKSIKRKPGTPHINNLVAKHSPEFTKSATHRDRKNDYRRKAKHTNREEG